MLRQRNGVQLNRRHLITGRTMTTTKLSSLSLFPATPEQVIESRRRTLSLEEYLHRDAISDRQEHARDGRLITWVLAPRNDPTTLDFVPSCETFRREGLVWRRSSSAGGESVTVPERLGVTCYGIASVLTPSSLWGKGYALATLGHSRCLPPARRFSGGVGRGSC